MTSQALLRGMGAMFRPRLLAILYLVSLVLSLAMALPYRAALDAELAAQPDPAAKAEQVAQPWWDDFKRAQAPALVALKQGSGLAIWSWILMSALLSGGVIGAFDRRAADDREKAGRPWTLGVFGADAGRHALPMLRFLGFSLLVAWLCDELLNGMVAGKLSKASALWESERLAVVADWALQGSFLLLFFGLAAWVDLARVQLVLEKRRSILASLVHAADRALSHPVAVFLPLLIFLGLELGLMALGSRLLAAISTGSSTGLWTWLAVSQLLVLCRLGLGLARLGGLASVVEGDVEEPARGAL
jgi:hypothetical protein